MCEFCPHFHVVGDINRNKDVKMCIIECSFKITMIGLMNLEQVFLSGHSGTNTVMVCQMHTVTQEYHNLMELSYLNVASNYPCWMLLSQS